jgi:hypothetical protein
MFEKLEVYQKAVDFADEIAALTEGFPRGYGFLVDQLNRAALSIATNLAEVNSGLPNPIAATSSRSRAARRRNVFLSWKSLGGEGSSKIKQRSRSRNVSKSSPK